MKLTKVIPHEFVLKQFSGSRTIAEITDHYESHGMQKKLSALKSFDFVVKVAERCNLACPYCYYFYQDFDASKSAPAAITDETVEELPRFLLRSVQELGLQKILVSLHGGEPTLIKKSKFDKLCTLLHQTLDDHVELKIAIQTNGTLIDAEWIEIFHRQKIHVGISLDGRKWLHDSTRIDRKGRGSYDKAVGALKAIQAKIEEGYDIGLGVIAVLHPEHRADQLEHLIEDLSIIPNLNIPRGGHDQPDVVSWNRNLEAQTELLQIYFDRYASPKFTFVRGISEYLIPLISDRSMHWAELKHAKSNFVATISSDGKLIIDDNVVGVDSSKAETNLTIFQSTLKNLLHSEAWQELNQQLDQPTESCVSCRWYRACRGGSIYNRFTKQDGYRNRSSLCDTIKLNFEASYKYAVEKFSVDPDALERRLAQKPTFLAEDAFKVLDSQNISIEDFSNIYGDRLN